MFQLRGTPLGRRTKKFLVAASLFVLCFVSFDNVFKANRLLTHLQPDSKFMEKRWPDLTPIVVPEFKFVFITIPKVGCTQWNRLARLMMGELTDLGQLELHNPQLNGLKYLSEYSTSKAESMLTDETWTKAIFVRNPIDRILSAFLDKAVHNGDYFDKHCCQNPYLVEGDLIEYEFCRRHQHNFHYFLLRTDDCHNVHWKMQERVVDSEWWPYINFVGTMDHAKNDSETLLKSLTSTKDGRTAWDEYGSTGWGENHTSAFGEIGEAHHRTNAHEKLREYYSPCTEAFVRDRWREDFTSPHFHFDEIILFDPPADIELCDFTLDNFKRVAATEGLQARI